MRTDPAFWPSPSSEEDLRAHVARRVRVLRRWRTAPLVAAPAILALVVALALPNAGTRLSTENVPADEPGTAESTTTTSTTSTTAGGGGIVVSEDPYVAVHATPPHRAYVRGVGSIPIAPPTGGPVLSTSHPVLVDPIGDGRYPDETAGSRSEPGGDITALDIEADATSVTTKLFVPDMATPFRRSVHGEPTTAGYKTVLYHGDGYFSLYATRDLATGAVSYRVTYWRPWAEAAGGAYEGLDTANVRGSLDLATGVFSMTVDFADLNTVLAQAEQPPMGPGTEVRPQGEVEVKYGTFVAGGDGVVHADPNFRYRLGD